MSAPNTNWSPVPRVDHVSLLHVVDRRILVLVAALLMLGCRDPVETLKTFEASWTRDAHGHVSVSCERTVKTDDMLKYLRNVPNVRSVVLNDTNVSDLGLRHLSRVKGVESFAVGNGRSVTNAGLEHLARMNELKDLALVGTQVSDEGIEQLANAGGIERLCLSSISDAGLRHLNKLPNLRRLELINSEITHVGVEHLKSIRRLTSLNLIRCNISDENARALKRGLPRCKTIVAYGRSS